MKATTPPTLWYTSSVKIVSLTSQNNLRPLKKQTLICEQLDNTMESIPYSNEEDLLMIIRLDIVLPKVNGQLLSFPTSLIGITVKANRRFLVLCDMLRDVHIENTNVVINRPLDVALRIINLGKSTET
jgi:hypothetical protein